MPTAVTQDAYAGVEDFLNRYANWERTGRFGRTVKLDRMRNLLKALGNPEAAGYDTILVAGSKGKGSTAAMIQSILSRSGERVGLYTSPHVVSWSERIRINDEVIPPDRALALARELERTLDQSLALRAMEPSYFELTTAMAFMHFGREGCTVAVLEVGLGGRWDATNACEALVSVITPIGFEHEAILGHRLAEIAREKCGIIKKGGVVVSAPQREEAEAVIREVSFRQRARLFFSNECMRIKEIETLPRSQRFELESAWAKAKDLEISLLGRHQLENASVACLAVTKCRELRGRPVEPDDIRRGLYNLRLPGRVEIAGEHPLVVLDGAHSPESAQALASALSRHFSFKRFYMIFGMLRDKDPLKTLEPFRGKAERIWLTPVSSERSYAVEELASKLGEGRSDNAPFPLEISASLHASLEKAIACADKEDLILVTGSLYLVGEAKRFFNA